MQYEANKPILEKYDDRQGSSIIMIKRPMNYSLGKLVGYSSLIIKSLKGSYQDGQLHGMSRIWYENGNLAEESIYEEGVLISKTSWDENGIIINEE
ncbi:hypothetical protein Ct9H90mP29_18250 [bacterium]|nr:MAG: hypothetical protein Ct9H90mP29_18250 [bacterium]